MKRGLALLPLIALTFLASNFPQISLAHPGNTDSFGCHTCRTNCPSWGRYYGEYHCHTPKTYDPYPPTPSCPLLSYYDSLTDSCKCYSGYIAQGGTCVSTDQYCRDILGFNSRYNSLTDKCECSYGYVYDGGKCVSESQYCWDKYGLHSSFDILRDSCKCNYGYVFNLSGTKCIGEDEACEEQYGYDWEYDSLKDACVKDAYSSFDFGSPTLPDNSYNIYSTPTPKPSPVPSPIPTKEPTPKLKQEPKVQGKQAQQSPPSPSPTSDISSNTTKNPISGTLTAGDWITGLGTLGATVGIPLWFLMKLRQKMRIKIKKD